ncbi:probable transcription factor At1g61730 [Phragmites australis]|uniref:probable transcription factor At1g61730 n=1 Tax=Phragmites australis TaxID=29695 RepID=UPI002D791DEB|nr:probable transcription factor At1g61730 [Phragmites australis]
MAPTTRNAQPRRTRDLLLPHQSGNADAQPEADGKKPAPFARVWSPEDDVRILEGLAAHTAQHGTPPGRSQLRDALAGRALDKAEFTVTDIYEKVRRLKTRYLNQRSTGGVAPGGDEARKYQLSTVIWGKEIAPRLAQPKVAKKESSTSAISVLGTHVRRGFEEMQCLYPNLAAAVERIASGKNCDVMGAVLKRALQFIDDEEAAELDAKVKKQRVLEAKMRMNRTTVRNEVIGALIKSTD